MDDLLRGAILMVWGFGMTFGSIIVFYALIALLGKLLPYKEEEDK